MSALEEVIAELHTLRIGARSAIDDVLPAIREALDADNVLIYSVTEREGGFALDRWHQHGNAGVLEANTRALFASSPRDALLYNARCPEVRLRNTVLEGTAYQTRKARDGWRESRMCRDVFAPAGMHVHKHLRALVCDGSALLAWFGTILPGTPSRQQARVLRALVAPMRRRLIAEGNLGRTLRPALDAVLANVGAPALVVGVRGRILEANAAARELLDTDRRALAEALANAIAGRPSPIELTPIAAVGIPHAWLAIVRTGEHDAVADAASRWQLTPRQREVLAGVVHGFANATIARNLDVSERAVEHHVSALLARADVDNRAALVAAVLRR